MNTNELIPFNWEEYQKGSWEAVADCKIITEVSRPDKNNYHCFMKDNNFWSSEKTGNMSMRRKLRDAWVVVTDSHEVDFFRNEEDGINFKKVLDDKGYASEIHKIKTAL